MGHDSVNGMPCNCSIKLVLLAIGLSLVIVAGMPTVLDYGTVQVDESGDGGGAGSLSGAFEVSRELVSNGTSKDLYVIKAVVYEIGILTEVDDNDTDSALHHLNVTQERVDLTFFDAHANGTAIDFGDIPLPVQTNVSGQILTGIAPVHIGQLNDLSEILATIPLTGTIVNITKSDTAVIRFSAHNVTDGDGDGATLLTNGQLNGSQSIGGDHFSRVPLIDNTLPILASVNDGQLIHSTTVTAITESQTSSSESSSSSSTTTTPSTIESHKSDAKP